jgi:hypothetical protein
MSPLLLRIWYVNPNGWPIKAFALKVPNLPSGIFLQTATLEASTGGIAFLIYSLKQNVRVGLECDLLDIATRQLEK